MLVPSCKGSIAGTHFQTLNSLNLTASRRPMRDARGRLLRRDGAADFQGGRTWGAYAVAACPTECMVVSQQQWASVMTIEPNWDALKVRGCDSASVAGLRCHSLCAALLMGTWSRYPS